MPPSILLSWKVLTDVSKMLLGNVSRQVFKGKGKCFS